MGLQGTVSGKLCLLTKRSIEPIPRLSGLQCGEDYFLRPLLAKDKMPLIWSTGSWHWYTFVWSVVLRMKVAEAAAGYAEKEEENILWCTTSQLKDTKTAGSVTAFSKTNQRNFTGKQHFDFIIMLCWKKHSCMFSVGAPHFLTAAIMSHKWNLAFSSPNISRRRHFVVTGRVSRAFVVSAE